MKRNSLSSVALVVALLGVVSTAFAQDRVVEVKIRADSEFPGLEAFRAMDGNRGTRWFTSFHWPKPKLPHEIVIDLGGAYEVTGFTYVAKVDKKPGGAIKDYEVYFAEKDIVLLPLAENVGKPVLKGTFEKPLEDNVVTFPAPVKGRYFRLRALSEATGTTECCGVADLVLHCEGVKFVGKPWSLRVDYPGVAEDVLALIEGFPLLTRLLELDNAWGWDAMALKEQLLPEGTEPFPGSGNPSTVFMNRRAIYDWRTMKWDEAVKNNPVDSPGLKVWGHRAYETDYYAVVSASPLIRLHMGRPQLEFIDNMTALYPKLPQSLRKDLPAKMDKIVAALEPYGAKKLPKVHNSHCYLLPGGTKMLISDFTVIDQISDEVRIKIDFEPAEPLKGRQQLPLFVPWRVADHSNEKPAIALGPLGPLEAGNPVPATGQEAARQWSDRPTGFASVHAMGQNGTTGGAGGKVVVVTNQADLEKYVKMDEPYIIRIKDAITIEPKGTEIRLASDKTIIGVGKTGEIVQGGFKIGPGVHNVILRNLTIRDTYLKGDWAGLKQDWDGLQLDNAHHIWVDHCHFTRHGDGCIDSRKGTTYMTVSWCIFSDHNKTFGCGWDNKARAQITLDHNWFRNTACRAPAAGQVLRAHYYNNLFQNVGAYGHLVLVGTNLIVQNCLFENVNRPLHRVDGTCTIASVGNVFRNTRDRHDVWGRAFFDPGRFYAYPLDKAEDLPKLLEKYAGPQENIGQQEGTCRVERVVNVKVRVDSEHPGMEAFKAMNGNPGTMWSTRWRQPIPDPPFIDEDDLGLQHPFAKSYIIGYARKPT